jgi:lipid II:glycine glycyltransferase (peptidoglycan interpeptide bridge formation enzyme)
MSSERKWRVELDSYLIRRSQLLSFGRPNRTRYKATCIDVDIDPDWDALVTSTDGGDLSQTTLWALSRKSLGFRAYRISVMDSDDNPVGACLLYAKKMAPQIWAGSIPRGPLMFVDRPEVSSDVIRKIVELSRQQGIRFLVLQPPECAAALDQAVIAEGFRAGVPSIAPEATIRLDLRQSDSELLKSMSSMRRRNIRKAVNAHFEIVQDQDITTFHRLHTATAVRQGFVPISLRGLQAQYDFLAPSGLCMMLIARYEGVPIAGLWLTRFAGTVTFKLAGWDANSAAPSHVNEALHWAAIQWARSQGAHTYDLGGFDRASAEYIMAGGVLTEKFRSSPSFFKFGFGGTLALFPRSRFQFTDRFTDFAFGRAAQYVFKTPALRKTAQRMRSG